MTAVEFPWPVHPAADLFPLISDEELAELTEDIENNGLIEPVWLYRDPERGAVLLDGRNRALACQRADIEVDTRFYEGDDPIGFSISQNLKRRHLTVGQKAAVAVEAEPLFAAESERFRVAAVAEANRKRAESKESLPCEADLPHMEGKVGGEAANAPFPVPHKRAPQARDQAAATVGVSGRAVGQFKRVADQAPDLAEKVRSGDMALDRAERVIRNREAEQRRVEQARAEAAAQPEPIRVDLRHGDFREVLTDVTGVDAVVTDPPYPVEFLPLLDDLAAWADKVLTPDGVLAVLIGQTYLPEVYRRLGGHRPYRWTACYLTDGPGYVSHPRKVQSNWKPLIVYGGGPRFGDIIRSEGNDVNAKTLHKWGQDYNAFHTIIERLTVRGQTVADPFMGSGTTLLAARALGRHVIGCDTEIEHVNTARKRAA